MQRLIRSVFVQYENTISFGEKKKASASTKRKAEQAAARAMLQDSGAEQ